jgi:methylenetetrahydrofolate dehydrogenase (NADP+) / methenyltetrahydrofolate cyclohydrolase
VYRQLRHDLVMTAIVLDGIATAARVLDAVAVRAAAFLASNGRKPGLGTILVGDDGPSASYVRKKHEACAAAGLESVRIELPASATQADVIAAIIGCNANPAVDAFIVQLPLPKGLNEEAALLAIDPNKDADGLHPVNLGRLVMGANGPVSCTPAGIVELLRNYDVPVAGKHVVVIGRGITIGRPLALLLALKRPGGNAAVTVVHTGVANLADYTRQADVVVAAAGSPRMVKANMIRPGAAVVSAGITWEGKKLVPDVDEAVGDVAGWITPRLGGVGPMTVAMLLRNTMDAAERK